MRPYILRKIHKEDLTIFEDIETVFQSMPDIEFEQKTGRNKEKIPISCHILCRAFARIFPVKCVDGSFFIPFWKHSWLETRGDLIIDVYPWALVGGPIMVLKNYSTPWANLYREGKILDLNEEELKERVEKATGIVKRVFEKEVEAKKPRWILNGSEWICVCGRRYSKYRKTCIKCGGSRPEHPTYPPLGSVF